LFFNKEDIMQIRNKEINRKRHRREEALKLRKRTAIEESKKNPVKKK